MIIDAKNKIVGRIGTVAAKRALLGETIDIVNCDEAVISGKKGYILNEFKRKQEMGTFKGPFLPKMPDRFVRRMIRGMLPYKQDKGRNAYKRIKCYIGVPKGFEGKDFFEIEGANVSKIKETSYVKIVEICKKLGAKL
jgi:large subunit ribosomal protein L13